MDEVHINDSLEDFPGSVQSNCNMCSHEFTSLHDLQQVQLLIAAGEKLVTIS